MLTVFKCNENEKAENCESLEKCKFKDFSNCSITHNDMYSHACEEIGPKNCTDGSTRYADSKCKGLLMLSIVSVEKFSFDIS